MLKATNTSESKYQTQKRVLFIQVSPGGGSLIALYEVLKRLDRQKIIPMVLCFYQNRFSAMLETIPGCKVIYINTNTVKYDVKDLRKRNRFCAIILLQLNALKQMILPNKYVVEAITRIIRNEHIDIVHHNNDIFLHRDCIRACLKTGVIQVIHNRSLTRYGNSPLPYLVDFYLIRKVDYCIAISNAVLDHFRRMFLLPVNYSILLRDIIDPLKYFPSPPDEELKKALGINAHEFVIACIGRITYWKGQHVLIEAASKLVQRFPYIKVLLIGPDDAGVGSASYAAELRAQVEQYGLSSKVVFTGNRDDIPALIHISDVIVHCSIKPEPQGMVILEGLLCKKRVIASDSFGSGELVKKYGGIACRPGDAEMLAALLEKEINNKGVAKIEDECYQRLLNDFEPSKQMKLIYNLYYEIL